MTRGDSVNGRGARAWKTVVDRLLATACVVLFAVLVGTVSWQVFTRQVLGAPSSWSEELAKYVFVWLGMFGAALVFSERGHIAVDIVVRKLPAQVQRIIGVLVQLAVFVFAALALVWGGARLTVLTWGQSLTALPGHLGLVYVVLPITGMLITVDALHHLIAILRRDEDLVDVCDSADDTGGQ